MAQEDLIIVDADGLVPRRVVPEQSPAERKHVLAPAADLLDEAQQDGVLAEALGVPWLGVRLDCQVDECCSGAVRTLAQVFRRSDARVRVLVFGGVEDAVGVRGAGCEDAGGGKELEVFLSVSEHVGAGEQAFQEDVAVATVAFSENLDWLGWVRLAEGKDV